MNQVSLQSVMGTVAAISFSDELQRWRKQLQTVEAVLQVWVKLQNIWVQLEEVYSSSEIATHLEVSHFTFCTVDKEWRSLMSAVHKNPSVLTSCLQEGKPHVIVTHSESTLYMHVWFAHMHVYTLYTCI